MEPIAPILAQASPPQGSGLIGLAPIVLIFAIFYVFMLRPQMKRQRQHDEMVKALKPKDKVIMNSGLHGTIVKVQEKDVIVEVADKVHLKFQRQSVSTVRSRDGDRGE